MKKSICYMPIIAILFLTQTLFAQIHVDENGSVGIGTDTPGTITKLKIDSDGINDSNTENKYLHLEYTGASVSKQHKGIYVDLQPSSSHGYAGYFIGGRVGLAGVSSMSGGGYRYGIVASGSNGGTTYGVYSTATSSEYYAVNRAVYGKASGSGIENVGIYGYAYGGTNNWAGFFNGNVNITGSITYSSDEKLKEDVKDLEKSIDKIKELKPKTYKYKNEKDLSLPEGKHFGLTAQDLEKVYPELVREVTNYVAIDPESEDDTQEESITYKAINYNEIIPILIQGMQDQQEMIEDQQTIIDDLLKRVEKLENE